MKAKVFSIDGQEVEQMDLPEIFETDVRPDLIKRAVISAQTARIQPWGPDTMAGKRTSAETWGKGHGTSRVRRVKGSRSPASGLAAFAPHTVGGRRAHPPRVEEVIRERMNKKERKLAIRSAISATKSKPIVASRGHAVDTVKELPLVLADDFEGLKKTSEVKVVLERFGVWKDVERVEASKKVRAGRGKMRGRRYRSAVGPLLVVAQDKGLLKGARNIPGLDVSTVASLNAELLAPGGTPGRLTVWTKGAIQKLAGGAAP
ncbi:MAG: 50S ribosomal protein L4 [Candidatus Hadarchaeota archaeon]